LRFGTLVLQCLVCVTVFTESLVKLRETQEKIRLMKILRKSATDKDSLRQTLKTSLQVT